MNNPMQDDKVEEIVGRIAEEMSEGDSLDTNGDAEEVLSEMAEELEAQEVEDLQEATTQDDDDEEIEIPTIDINDMEPMRVLEAMLFASASPLTPQAMLERLPESADLNVLLPQLKEKYAGGGIELMEINGAYALRTAQDVGDALTVEKEVSRKMSKAALETMAIIAYHQPITRAEIENIRGVATHKGTLDILMEMGWVKPGRRRETPGRPLTWLTTNDFMDHFQLEAMTDLPGLDDLKASGLLDRRAAIDTLPDSGDLFDDADTDAEEVLDASDEDAYDEATYKEMKARANQQAAADRETDEVETGENE
jgi:segregation and condensation protein B